MTSWELQVGGAQLDFRLVYLQQGLFLRLIIVGLSSD